MSMLLRTVHTVVTEDYGYPAWVSYAGFAAATIAMGAVLGLVRQQNLASYLIELLITYFFERALARLTLVLLTP